MRWLAGDERARVLDLGAGTGKLTRSLVRLGHDVIAVEPSPEMLAQLRAVLPDVDAREGRAEAIPLPDASRDVVVAGQSFHWFDPALALPEIARVLRPGGRLGAVWNMFDEERQVAARLYTLLPPYESKGEPTDPIGRSDLFGPLEEARFTFERLVGRDDFVANIGTSSAVATLPPADRDEVLDAVGRFWDAEAGASGLVLPYRTLAYRAARL